MLNLAAALLILTATSPAIAAPAGMSIEPGSWEFTVSSTNPMSPQPRVSNETSCITDDTLTPDIFMSETKGCTLSDSTVTKDSMTWKMSCPGPQASMEGEGKFTSTGSSATGEITMKMGMPGMAPMIMTSNWVGKRVGDCEE